MESNLKAALLSQLLIKFGFEAIKNTSIMKRLSYVRPDGETALRDATLTGIQLMINLNKSLLQLELSQAFSFVHIVITDGVDTVSKTPLDKLALMFGLIGRGIPKDRCLTVLIGIDLTAEAAVQLALLSALGGDTCQLYNVHNVELNEIFQRIKATIGIRRQTSIGMFQSEGMAGMAFQQQSIPVMMLQRKNFAVVLNLDISGSMNGQRFNSLKNSVQRFLNNLEQTDVVTCLVFNEKVQMLNNYQPRQTEPPNIECKVY
jgi:uncharacterized protein YegL